MVVVRPKGGLQTVCLGCGSGLKLHPSHLFGECSISHSGQCTVASQIDMRSTSVLKVMLYYTAKTLVIVILIPIVCVAVFVLFVIAVCDFYMCRLKRRFLHESDETWTD
jgi:hypothetical protein